MTTTRSSIPAHRAEMPWWSAPVLGIGSLIFLIWFLSTGVSQIVVTSLLISLGIVGVFLNPDVVIIGTFIFLPFLGDIRRYVNLGAGRTPNDPLLVVAPAMVALLFGRLLFEKKIKPNTLVAKLVISLMIIMTVEILNPLQGGITVGVVGALYYLVPLLWFWVGRSMPTERVTRAILTSVVPMIGIAAVALGLFQTYMGWLSFEAQWIREQAQEFTAIMVGDKIVRPFAFFTSPAEFAGYLSIAFICCAMPLLARRLTWRSILAIPIGYMLFLSAVRTAIVLSILGIVVAWSAMAYDARRIIVRVILIVFVVLPVLYLGLARLKITNESGKSNALMSRSFSGLLHPEESTAGGHSQEAVEGIISGIKNPIGYGLGATTMAAGKFGNGKTAGYEQDVANIFSSLGVGGGILYLILMLVVFRMIFKVWHDTQSLTAVIVMGILVSQLSNWLTGSHYSTSALIWFLIGAMDRTQIPVLSELIVLRRSRPLHANPARKS